MLNYTEVEIMQYVDGQLDSARASQLQQDAQTSPELAEAIEMMQASRLPIQAAFEHREVPPVPSQLRQLVSAADPAQKSAPRRLFHLAVAASLCAGLVFGALFTHSEFMKQDRPGVAVQSAELSLSANGSFDEWVDRVVQYQSLYTEQTVKNVDPAALANAQRLLSGVAARSDIHAAIPDLSGFGYEFARAQELGFDGRALVQLVYRKPGSAPLAFCYMRSAPDMENQGAFVKKMHRLSAASWSTDGQQYVLVADESEQLMLAMTDTLKQSF